MLAIGVQISSKRHAEILKRLLKSIDERGCGPVDGGGAKHVAGFTSELSPLIHQLARVSMSARAGK